MYVTVIPPDGGVEASVEASVKVPLGELIVKLVAIDPPIVPVPVKIRVTAPLVRPKVCPPFKYKLYPPTKVPILPTPPPLKDPM